MPAQLIRFGVLLPLVALSCSAPRGALGQSTSSSADRREPNSAGQARPVAPPPQQRVQNPLVQPMVRQPAAPVSTGSPAAQPYAQPRLAANAGPLGPPIPQQQPPPQGPSTPPTGGPPFQLSPIEHRSVMQILQMWETKSQEIKTFTSDFERLEYDAVFGPGSETPIIISKGRLSYSRPDRGSFKIEQISRWKPSDPKNPGAGGNFAVQKNEIGEHWVCDGKAVYEYDHRNKQLVVTTIPPEMRGAAIVDGPLPFLFGAEAEKLDQRYWIRSTQGAPKTISLEAYPRWAADAQNYQRVEIMLDPKTMQPTALQVHLPGGQQRHVYIFNEPTVNGKLDALFGGLFDTPKVPWGWKRVNQDDVAGSQAANSPGESVQR